MIDSPTLAEIKQRIKSCAVVGEPILELDQAKIYRARDGRVFVDLETILTLLYRAFDAASDAEPRKVE